MIIVRNELERALASINVNPPYYVTALDNRLPWKVNRLTDPDLYVFVHQPRGLYPWNRAGSLVVDHYRSPFFTTYLSTLPMPTVILSWCNQATAFFALDELNVGGLVWGLAQQNLRMEFGDKPDYIGTLRLVPVRAIVAHHDPRYIYTIYARDCRTVWIEHKNQAAGRDSAA